MKLHQTKFILIIVQLHKNSKTDLKTSSLIGFLIFN